MTNIDVRALYEAAYRERRVQTRGTSRYAYEFSLSVRAWNALREASIHATNAAWLSETNSDVRDRLTLNLRLRRVCRTHSPQRWLSPAGRAFFARTTQAVCQ